MKKYVLCGPWIGEFAYELHAWAPKLRYEIHNIYNNDYYVVHFGFPGRELLYRDFVDEYVSYPQEILDQLPPPNSGGAGHEGEHRLALPITEKFVEDWIENNTEDSYEIHMVRPQMLRAHTKDLLTKNYHFDNAEFLHLKPDSTVNDVVKSYIEKFSEGKDVVAIMAPDRHERKIYRENWNPRHWKQLIKKIITKLDVKVIVFGVESKDNMQGSQFFDLDIDGIMNWPIPIRSVALDEQFAILQNTKCSIFGSTGAVYMTFFANTPVFAQVVNGQVPRLSFRWVKELTDNHKNVKFLSKYEEGTDLYDSPVEEMFEEFKKFYKKLK